jgi:hypothetical protein
VVVVVVVVVVGVEVGVVVGVEVVVVVVVGVEVSVGVEAEVVVGVEVVVEVVVGVEVSVGVEAQVRFKEGCKMSDRIMNIYGQYAWHTEAKIVASRDALEALKKAIDRAIYYGYAELGSGNSAGEALYASDGEGYKFQIWCFGGWDDKRWQDYKPEYTMLREETK